MDCLLIHSSGWEGACPRSDKQDFKDAACGGLLRSQRNFIGAPATRFRHLSPRSEHRRRFLPPRILPATRSGTTSRPLSRRLDDGVPERRRSAPSEGHAATCQEAAGGPFRSGEVTRPVLRCWGQRGCCASAATPKLMHDGPPFYGAEFKGHEGETPPSETGINKENLSSKSSS